MNSHRGVPRKAATRSIVTDRPATMVELHFQSGLSPSMHPGWYSGTTTYRTKYISIDDKMPVKIASHAHAGKRDVNATFSIVLSIDGTMGAGFGSLPPPGF